MNIITHHFEYYEYYHFKGFPGSSAGKESTCDAGDPVSIPGLGRNRLLTPVFLGFPWGSAEKSACNAEDLGSIPGLGRSPGERKGKATHSSILAWRIPMDKGAW